MGDHTSDIDGHYHDLLLVLFFSDYAAVVLAHAIMHRATCNIYNLNTCRKAVHPIFMLRMTFFPCNQCQLALEFGNRWAINHILWQLIVSIRRGKYAPTKQSLLEFRLLEMSVQLLVMLTWAVHAIHLCMKRQQYLEDWVAETKDSFMQQPQDANVSSQSRRGKVV